MLVLLLAGSTATVPMSPANAQETPRRLGAFEDVVLAAVSISEETFEPGAAALAAVGRDDVFADSLAAAALVGTEGPLLFTGGGSGVALRSETLAEVQRALGPAEGCDAGPEVYLLGGEQAVSEDAATAFLDAGYCVSRAGGASRVETSVIIAEVIESRRGVAQQILLARADDWADAATGGAFAAAAGAPVLVTQTSGLHPAASAFLARADRSDIVLLGGTVALAQQVEQGAAAHGVVRRVAGAARDATAAAIGRELWQPRFALQGVAVLSGYVENGWAFALAAASAAAAEVAPELYVQPDGVPPGTAEYLDGAEAGATLCIGPTTLLSDGVCQQVANRGGQPPPPPLPPPDPTPTSDPEPTPGPNPGTRETPYPVGAVVPLIDGWELSVRSSTPDGTEAVLDENQFNDPPDDGRQFFLARVRATATQAEPDRFDGSFRLRAVGASGVAYSTFEDSCGVIPDALSNREVFPGGTVEGNVCWEVSNGDAGSLLLFDDDFAYGDESRPFFQLLGEPAPDTPPPAPPPPDSGDPTGSRGSPHPAGSTVALIDSWELTVMGVQRDATAAVLAENQFNEPPAQGNQFFIVRVRATYRGGGSDFFDGSFRLRTVGAARAVGYTTFEDSCGVIPDPLPSSEVFSDGSIEGNLCWSVATNDAASLVLFDDHSEYEDAGARPFLGPPE